MVTIKTERHRSPKQARAERTRARILDSARTVFAECGFDAANIRDIAAAADTTHSMIKYYFGTKDALWREAVATMFARMDEELRLPPESEDWSDEEKFRGFIRLYVRYCARHPEHARITVAETIRGGERLEWMVDKFVKHAHELNDATRTNLMAKGALPEVPRHLWVYLISGMAQQPFVLASEARAVFDIDITDDAMVEAYAEVLINVLLRPTATGTSKAKK